ncbi:hypothetical protein BC939DRAFT_507933 [Gamsiella multidivaricata]|uniref:uncharacterized protein n=1 Tax=Gamsiella multidivaricata TaxID=101098 RepID=UPI00221EFD03|nr:uncharacterized protein BC939DRAFT_507933 [Gamsiella multidivaricata]KAI7816838.1 hypothetical protein BC939DRAFT_507933 [Gamsiella multidivaricata]
MTIHDQEGTAGESLRADTTANAGAREVTRNYRRSLSNTHHAIPASNGIRSGIPSFMGQVVRVLADQLQMHFLRNTTDLDSQKQNTCSQHAANVQQNERDHAARAALSKFLKDRLPIPKKYDAEIDAGYQQKKYVLTRSTTTDGRTPSRLYDILPVQYLGKSPKSGSPELTRPQQQQQQQF